MTGKETYIMALRSKRTRELLYHAASLLVGNFLLAFLVEAFIVPHDIIMGGATGIGLCASNLFGLDMAMVVLIFNILALILGAVVLGKAFFLSTVVSSFLYPGLITVVRLFPGIHELSDDILMSSIFAGLLLGLALGIIMRIGSSTGGTDVINLVMHKWTRLPLSVLVYLLDFLIIGVQMFFSDIQHALYGILAALIETIVLDKVMLLGQSQLQIFVISEKYEEIRERILNTLEAGATLMYVETGWTGRQQKGVLCVLPRRKLHAATSLVQSVDPDAFITITQINEVRGQGFTLERRPVPAPQRDIPPQE